MSSAQSYGPWPPVPAAPGGGPSSSGGTSRWAPWTAWAGLFAALAFAIFGEVAIGVIGAIFGASLSHPPPAVTIVATVVQDGAFVGSAILFAGRAGAVLPAQFGFVRTRVGRALGTMALAYFGYWVLSAVWSSVFNAARVKDNLPTSLGVNDSTAALVAVCVLVTTIAPIAEETFFRGFFFRALSNWRGPWLGALLTAIVFGAIHAGSAPAVFLVPLGILGFALCVVRWRTGSLLPCIALHALNNGFAFGVSQHWTAGQTILLMAGAVSVTMLACQPLLGWRPGRV